MDSFDSSSLFARKLGQSFIPSRLESLITSKSSRRPAYPIEISSKNVFPLCFESSETNQRQISVERSSFLLVDERDSALDAFSIANDRQVVSQI
jgi:hypothetical protein